MIQLLPFSTLAVPRSIFFNAFSGVLASLLGQPSVQGSSKGLLYVGQTKNLRKELHWSLEISSFAHWTKMELR